MKHFVPACCLVAVMASRLAAADEPAELIIHNGKVVTVDRDFAIRQAMAVRGGKIVRVGGNEDVLAMRGPDTRFIDLAGRMVLPGLIDSHVHPTGASMFEFDHEIPTFRNIPEVLQYVQQRAKSAKPGQWIVLSQVFITRLEEQRYPTRAELDEAAPHNPVLFRTGPDASVNSAALALSGIDRDFVPPGTGKIEKDVNGQPTGILRGAGQYVKVGDTGQRKATEAERDERLRMLFADYNSVGLTGIIDRDCSSGALAQYRRLLDAGVLSVRVAASHSLRVAGRPVAETISNLDEIASHPLRKPNPMLRIIGTKTYLDGGMLTGSAYMLDPWGTSSIYSIDDPRYRGIRYIEPETLVPVVRAAVERGLQFTAHSVGDGAVTTLVDAYDEVNRTIDVRPTRPCVTHANFQSRDVIDRAARLGVVFDIQPAWLWLDTRTLLAQFGYDRLRYFQPLASLSAAGVVAGGGSDHMQKIGSLRSVNPYNPFLGMWVAITRSGRHVPEPLHPEEALSREQAIRFYTANNAYLMFLEDQVGTLEAGKLADFIIVDRDLLACGVDDIRDTQVLATYLAGRPVFERQRAAPAP